MAKLIIMDPITHGILGASCAYLALSKKNNRIWIAGGLAAMAPDLDVLIHSASDPLLELIYHRQFTHSFIFIPFGAALVTLFLMLFKTFQKSWMTTYFAALIGFSTHGLLDALTTYGTVLYWPFSYQRVSWDIVSIVDPFVTFPLILGLIWTVVNQNLRGVKIGFILAGLVILLNSFQYYRVNQAIKAYAQTQDWQITALRNFPGLASSTQWRGIGIINQELLVMDIHAFLKPAKITKVQFYPLFQPAQLPKYVKDSPKLLKDYESFAWFGDNYLILVNNNPLTLADGRFLLSNPVRSIWTMQFLPNGQVQKINIILKQ